MRYVQIEDLESGMEVAREVRPNPNQAPILPYGAHLNEKVINALKSKGYDGIYIKDELTKDVIVNGIVDEKEKYNLILKLSTLKQLYKELGETRLKQAEMHKGEKIDINKLSVVGRKIESIDRIISDCYKDIKGLARDISRDSTFDITSLQGAGNNLFENSIAVAEICMYVGSKMGIYGPELEELGMAALFHDFGKIVYEEPVIGAAVYINPSAMEVLKIKREEIRDRKNHAFFSYGLLYYAKERAIISSKILSSILFHSTREDMPPREDLKQNTHSKLIGIADEYVDVYTGKYGMEYATLVEAREKLMTLFNTQFNGPLVKKFLDIVPPYPKGTQVKLSNGLVGVVKEIHEGQNISRPIVAISEEYEFDLSKSYDVVVDEGIVQKDKIKWVGIKK